MAEESRIAVFVDFENLAIGSRDMHEGAFRIDLVLKRLLEKGRIVFKRAYCDWNRYRGAVRDFHAQGIEMIDIPSSRMSGKNSADIRMVVDALDLCHSKGHIDIFALLTGDSDFSPLVNKLKENNKRVIGCGVKSSTSDLLVGSCDEFLYYDELVKTADKISRKRTPAGRTVAAAIEKAPAKSAERTADQTAEAPAAQASARGSRAGKTSRSRRGKKAAAPEEGADTIAAGSETDTANSAPIEESQVFETAETEGKPAKAPKPAAKRTRSRRGAAKAEAEPVVEAEAEAKPDPQTEGIDMLVAIVMSLAQDYDPVWGSLVKQTLRRVHPDFREERYGYTSFVELLKDAEKRGYVTLEYDQPRGNYKIRVKA